MRQQTTLEPGKGYWLLGFTPFSMEVSCLLPEYTLTIDSTVGGSITAPGEGTLAYPSGTVVLLEAEPDEDYSFVNWTGDVDTIADVTAASATITMQGNYSITAVFDEVTESLIRNWHDLDNHQGQPEWALHSGE
jgi:hypothetical protein